MNILLITAEDSGPHLGCFGDLYAQTPNLDHLAAEGTRFTNTYTTQAVCSPGRASILTGLYPHQNGQIGLATHQFSMYREFPTISFLLKTAGYRTGRIGKLHVLPESASPFDMVWNPPEYWSFQHRDIERAAQVASEFMVAEEGPFFLMMNFPDAHLPWLSQDGGYPQTPLTADDVEVPPGVGCDSVRLRAHAANYYNCLSRLDSGIGLVLEALEKSGKAEETLVIFIADHGPQFSRGKACINELALRIPLIIRWPGVTAAGGVRNELTSQIDVLPTICDAVGLPIPEDLPGRSLRPLIGGEKTAWRDTIFAEWTTSHPYPLPGTLNPQRSVRDQRYKLILNLMPGVLNPVENYYTQQVLVNTGCTQEEIDAAPAAVQKAYTCWRNLPKVELYDLQEDPWEYVNLADNPNYAANRDRLMTILQTWQEETNDPLINPEGLTKFIAEHHAATLLEGGHKSPNFHWDYLERSLH
jgi:N-sulfoglucosamine sulfohydrolase